MRDFHSLSQKEILALAISLEEEDERIYSDFSENLRENFPGTAQIFEEMRQEEIGHRRRLIDLYKQKFGEHIPLIRRGASTCMPPRGHGTRPFASCLMIWQPKSSRTSSGQMNWKKPS